MGLYLESILASVAGVSFDADLGSILRSCDQQLAFDEFQARKHHAAFDIRTVVFRNAEPEKFREKAVGDREQWHLVWQTLDSMKEAMALVYRSYEGQGPERSELVPVARTQEPLEHDRVTHFALGANDSAAN